MAETLTVMTVESYFRQNNRPIDYSLLDIMGIERSPPTWGLIFERFVVTKIVEAFKDGFVKVIFYCVN